MLNIVYVLYTYTKKLFTPRIKADDRSAASSSSPPSKKDIKGVEMKKMLDKAKGIINQLSDMNELRLAIKNAIETIMKTVGYLMEYPTPAIYRIENEYDKVGLYVFELFP